MQNSFFHKQILIQEVDVRAEIGGIDNGGQKPFLEGTREGLNEA